MTMGSRAVAVMVAVVVAFASNIAISATFDLCHSRPCCAVRGQEVSAPLKCCNESACEKSTPIAAGVEHQQSGQSHASLAAVDAVAAASGHSTLQPGTSHFGAASIHPAFSNVLRI
jgi:hypothetical protein